MVDKKRQPNFTTRPDGPPTLSSVSQALGVSRTTISNAYSRPDQLSPQLRERIFAAARALGYSGPHPSARALARGNTGVIGVVFPEELTYPFTDAGAHQFTWGMVQACMETKFGFMMLPTAADTAEGEQLIRTAAVDGLVLCSLADDHPLLDVILSRRLTTVSIDQPALDQGVRVGVDEAGVVAAQIEHLTSLGHRRLALIGYRFGPVAREGFQKPARLKDATYLINRLHYKGFNRALRRAGLGWSDVVIYETPTNTVEAGAGAAREVLHAHPEITGMVIDSDTLARGAVTAARHAGRRVPDDLSVIGVDDNINAVSARPHLSTIALPVREKGHTAALLAAGNGESAGSEVLLPFQLVVRESTGPAPSA